MTRLEDLQPHASVRGLLPDALATVVGVEWHGSEVVEVTFKDPAGRLDHALLHRHDEPRLEIAELGRPWSFDGDGALFRLVSASRSQRNPAHPTTPAGRRGTRIVIDRVTNL